MLKTLGTGDFRGVLASFLVDALPRKTGSCWDRSTEVPTLKAIQLLDEMSLDEVVINGPLNLLTFYVCDSSNVVFRGQDKLVINNPVWFVI